MKTPPSSSRRPQRRYVVAMLIGTALSALGASPAYSAQSAQAGFKAVNDISRYCTTCWRNAHLHPDFWNDCTQEVFSRLLERVPAERWEQVLQAEGLERQEFLRAIDAVKKRTQRSLKRSTNLTCEVADPRNGRDRRLSDDREVVEQASAELLTVRQQRIMRLSFEGWSVQDIATELQLPPERVSDEKYKAIRKLREHLCRAGECQV
jgi:RNA polymerase sigma factor (sigma-70 family)